MRYYLKIVICFSLLCLQTNLQANEEKKEVRHYIETNIAFNYIFEGGDRLENQESFAPGIHIAHGTNITPVHALVLSYGKDFLDNNATLTTKALFLRRYMPKFSTSELSLYSTIGSAIYTYENNDTAGALENAGIIIGVGLDYHYTKKIRLSLEADYRGFTVKQFGSNDEDYIRPVTLFLGIKYYYSTTAY